MEALNICSSAIVGGEVLQGKENYKNWSVCIKNYLLVRDLWDVVELEEADMEDWRKRNLSALHAIQISCAPTMLSRIIDKTTAKDAWKTLAEICEPPSDLPGRTGLPPEVAWEVQHGLAIFKYFENTDLENTERRRLIYQELSSINNKILELSGSTWLHFAILERSLEIVDLLLRYLSEEDGKKTDLSGYTALHYVARFAEDTRIAESVIRRNNGLLTSPNNYGLIPLVYACDGHKDMVRYLYKKTTPEYLLHTENRFHAVSVLCCCVRSKKFDVARDLLCQCPKLALARCPNLEVAKWERDDTNAVLLLSRQPSAFLSCCELSFWQRWIYDWLNVKQSEALFSDEVEVPINTHEQQDLKERKNFMMQVERKLFGLWSDLFNFFGLNQIYDLKLTHHDARMLLDVMSGAIASLDTEEFRESELDLNDAIVTAAKLGIKEFIVEIIQWNRYLLWSTSDQDMRTIFMIAVSHRQENIFSLIYPCEAFKHESSASTDKYGNTMLHLAGRLEPDAQIKLEQISGAALQMQRELQWFKEIESVVPAACKYARNHEGKTPYEVFDESHTELMKDGMQWMKNIAQSSTIVGTLIITIMFAALFTVPGGNNQETGIPLLLTRKLFKIFIVSDAISLFASSTSVLVSFGILTSRYRKDDFLTSLPTKLIIGLLAIFISNVAMVVAFCSALIMMVKGQLEIVIPVVVFAAIPVYVCVWSQFPLLVRIFISTYGRGIFDKKMEKWL